MGFLSQAFKDQIMSPIGRPMPAMGVRPMLREPGLDIPGERSIFEQPSPFGPPLPPTPRPPVVGGPALPPVDPRIIPQRPPSIGGIGGINQPLQPVLQQPQPPQTGGIPVTGGGPLGSGILPIANLPTGPVSPPTNTGRLITTDAPGVISAVPQEPIQLKGTQLPPGTSSGLSGVGPATGPNVGGGPKPIFTTSEIERANQSVSGPVPMPSLADLSMPKITAPEGPPLAQVTLGSGITPEGRDPFQKMPLPPKRDDFMSIGGPGGGFTDTRQAINPETGQPYTPVLGAGGGPEFRRGTGAGQIGNYGLKQRKIDPTSGTYGDRTQPSVGDGMTSPSLIGQEIQPPVTDPTISTEPVTTPTDPNMSVNMPVAPIDPVLLQQSASEVQTDPLLRSLYFGTADSPGFYNQLQQAGANLIGSDVPLQQTAGLTPLELLARQQAVAGLGGFEPFLQQNRNLVNQAIEQSRRAEGLQDPYYTQAEEIYKDTMGAYDPSMTQQFYNPYEDAVVQQTIEDVMKAGDKQDIAARAREISSGAFGGSRARLGAEERRQDLGEGLAKALSGIRQTGFRQAQSTGLSEFARQQAAKRTGAQGLMGIGVGRGSAASDLGRQLAGYGSQMAGLGRTQEELRRGQRGELSGYGTTGRGIAETGLGRIYEQQMGQQMRPLGVLGQIGSMLPGYQAASSRIDSQYGMPTDPAAAGLGAAFSAYGAVAPKQGGS